MSSYLGSQGANIFQSDQYSTDPEGGAFFMRVEFHLEGIDENRDAFEAGFADVAGQLGMEWRISYTTRRKRVAVLVSRYDHCLLDLLWRWRRGELDCDIALVVSNHPDLREDVESFGLPYAHIPVAADSKSDSERRLLELLRAEQADLVVLARYMQILSGELLDALDVPLINIHHSFLPAFAGANPYEQAKRRGVKLIGATAHYVTEELDAGPIIEQDTTRVSHRQGVAELERMGADIERLVLARAVNWHLEDRVLVKGNRTVVFT